MKGDDVRPVLAGSQDAAIPHDGVQAVGEVRDETFDVARADVVVVLDHGDAVVVVSLSDRYMHRSFW